jgi:hypothetical protein
MFVVFVGTLPMNLPLVVLLRRSNGYTFATDGVSRWVRKAGN